MPSKSRRIAALVLLIVIAIVNFALPLPAKHRVGISSGLFVLFYLVPFVWWCIKMRLGIARHQREQDSAGSAQHSSRVV